MNLIKCFKNLDLFYNLSDYEISIFISNLTYYEKKYKHDYTIIKQDDLCTQIGFLLNGTVNVYKNSLTNEKKKIKQLSEGSMLCYSEIFLKNQKSLNTLITKDNTKILWISKENFINSISKNQKLINNFLSSLSQKICDLNKTIDMLSLNSLRSKISIFLLEQYKIYQSSEFDIKMSRNDMAEIINIPRPSLSRELSHMKKDNLIDFDKSIFILKDITSLKDIIKKAN